ncbi:hypothetical protein D3C84_1173150 [compost metagenome]
MWNFEYVSGVGMKARIQRPHEPLHQAAVQKEKQAEIWIIAILRENRWRYRTVLRVLQFQPEATLESDI